MVFHLSLSDSKSPRLSRTLLSILADLNNAVIFMVSTRPPISNSSISFYQAFEYRLQLVSRSRYVFSNFEIPMFFMYTCYLNELWTIDVHFPNSHIRAMVHLPIWSHT